MTGETKALLEAFANATETAAALARKIIETASNPVEIRLDAETMRQVYQLTSRDNPEASKPSPADS